ncbi:MAG: hypothetical protein KGY76_07355 [Candidatus Thermoplasmatota archaeon]|nr:hypothetical protein [Candidatus Thermoplasmatota archaeon]
MDKRIVSAGLVILIIGFFLVVAFWPIFGVSGSGLADDRKDNEYGSYDEGDEVLVHGTITEKSEPPEWLDIIEDVEKRVYIEIDDDFSLILKGKNSTDFEVGDDVYCELKLKKGTFLTEDYEYWEMEGDLSSKTLVDYLFYGITGTGIVIAVVGAVKD